MATQDLSQLLPFLQMLQGGGESQIQPVSGLSQPVPLSGLALGEQGMGLGSGGSLLGATPGGGFGGPGGAGLDFFQLLSALQGDVGAPSAGFLGQPRGGGTIGQGFGAGGQLLPQQQGVPEGTTGQAGLGGGGSLGDISVLLKTLGQLSKIGQVPTASPTGEGGFPAGAALSPEISGTPGMTGTAQSGISFIDDPVLFQKALGQARIAPGGAEFLPGALQNAGGLDLTGPLSMTSGLRGAETPLGQPGGAALGQEGGSALGGLLGPALAGLPFGVELGTRLASGEGINAFPTTGLHALPFTGLGDIGSLLGRGPSALTGVNPFARFGLGAATGGLSELFGGLLGGGGPSAAFQSFPGRVVAGVQPEVQAGQTLLQALAGAQTPGAIPSAIAQFKSAIGQLAGGFGAGSGPFDIPSLPETGARVHGVNLPLASQFWPSQPISSGLPGAGFVDALRQAVAMARARFPEMT